jgi:putative addiction module killer protein
MGGERSHLRGIRAALAPVGTIVVDRQAQARIAARIRRASLGNLGDMKPLREGLLELRIDYDPGYRLYCIRKGQILIVLLSGGDKKQPERRH